MQRSEDEQQDTWERERGLGEAATRTAPIDTVLKGNRPAGAAVFLVLSVVSPIHARQATSFVPVTDPAYRNLDKLIAFDLVGSVIHGQRPYTRADFRRFVRRARSNAPDARLPAGALRILERLEQRFSGDLPDTEPSRIVGDLRLTFTRARTPSRNALRQPFAGFDATINPMLGNRQGRRIGDGTTVGLESTHEVAVAPAVRLVLRPRLAYASERVTGDDDAHAALLEGYALIRAGNLTIQIGRADLRWGQGLHGGTLISGNARGFDMVHVSQAEPRRLPWIFSILGPVRGSLFFATTAADRARRTPNSYMIGYKISMRPTRSLELGGGFVVEAGGRGSPPASLVTRVLDHAFVLDYILPTPTPEISNRMLNVEARVDVPAARGLKWYAEILFDDITIDNFAKWLKQDAGYLIGIHVPRLDVAGRLDASLEYQYTGANVYRHSVFSGMEIEGNPIGSVLGPEARAGYFQLNWDVAATTTLSFDAAYEARRHDEWRLEPGDLYYQRIAARPLERRYRAGWTWTLIPPDRSVALSVVAAYERVDNFGFIRGRSENNYLFRGELRWMFP